MTNDRPSNGRPMQFLQYRCGHSTPVRGTGAMVNRLCETCATTGQRYTGLGMIRLEQILGRRPTGYQTSNGESQ